MPRRRRLDSRVVRGLLSLGLVIGVGATGTYALWTDAVPIAGTAISSGTIDLKVENSDTTVNFTSMNISTMVPGNTVAGVLTVKNSGTAPLRYYVDAQASNADGKNLGTNLQVKVTGDSTVTGSSPAATCAGTALPNAATAFTTAVSPLLGTSSTTRLLASGGTETVCIQATLPTSATSTLQGATTNITMTFRGTSF